MLSREWGEFGIYSKAEVVKVECASESLGRLIKTQSAESHPRVSDSWGLGVGSKFSHEANAAELGTHFEKYCSSFRLWGTVCTSSKTEIRR